MSSTDLSDPDLLRGLLQFTVELAREAGELIRQGSKAVSTVDEKKNAVDLVTKWDRAVEALVKERISAKYGPQFELCVGAQSPPSPYPLRY
jgi:myo-inositol-1(or 4)-monophosphatase